MMRSVIVWGLFVVGVVGVGGVAACGGNGLNIDTSADTVCDSVAEVACHNLYQCCSEGEIEATLHVINPRTVAQCRADVVSVCTRQIATLDFSVKNKHVRFDADLMNSCLEALAAPDGTCASVEAMKPWTLACMDSAWVGIVDAGGACDFSYECVKDTFCNSTRMCTALPGVGMSCANQPCASGLYCEAGTCHAQKATGEACANFPTTQCQKGLFCDFATPVDGFGACAPQHALGDHCTGNTTCESTTCLIGTCAVGGAGCFNTPDCSSHCADDSSICNTDANCALGTCTVSGTTCAAQADCGANTCVFPVKCLPTECVGNVVCAEPNLSINYCQNVNEIPGF